MRLEIQLVIDSHIHGNDGGLRGKVNKIVRVNDDL